MAEYIVRVWDIASITKQREVVRKTRPAAFYAYRKAVYDVLAAFGKLDTEAAHHAMAVATAHDDLLQVGEERGLEVSNTGQSVKIIRKA